MSDKIEYVGEPFMPRLFVIYCVLYPSRTIGDILRRVSRII